MDTWYQPAAREIVFACGGGIYTSAADAAKKVGAPRSSASTSTRPASSTATTGVEGMTVTSAMKGLCSHGQRHLLTDVIVNGNWDKYGGKIETLGLVSGDDPEAELRPDPDRRRTQWADGKFTQADYKALVKAMFDGTVTVSNDITRVCRRLHHRHHGRGSGQPEVRVYRPACIASTDHSAWARQPAALSFSCAHIRQEMTAAARKLPKIHFAFIVTRV